MTWIVCIVVVVSGAVASRYPESSAGSDGPPDLTPEGAISTPPSPEACLELEEASQHSGFGCGCCFDEFDPWPLKQHVMYASGHGCPGGGAKRALAPEGAHGDWRWGSCYQGNKHRPCHVLQ